VQYFLSLGKKPSAVRQQFTGKKIGREGNEVLFQLGRKRVGEKRERAFGPGQNRKEEKAKIALSRKPQKSASKEVNHEEEKKSHRVKPVKMGTFPGKEEPGKEREKKIASSEKSCHGNKRSFYSEKDSLLFGGGGNYQEVHTHVGTR